MTLRPVWFAAAFLVLCGGLVLVPGIDLWASALFYRPGDGFFQRDWLVFRAIHDGLPTLVAAFVTVLAAVLILALIRRRAVLGLTCRAAGFLLLALALGPGLTVNTLFKDHWGRARPAQIVEFGGDKKFSPAFVPSDQCARNCSFPAGDPSIGFYLVSLAFLSGAPRQRRRGITGAVALGAALGVVRLAQGGHFLSDVVAAGFLVCGISWLLQRALIVHDGFGALLTACRKPSLAMQRAFWLGLAALGLFFLSYAVLDQPIARYFHDIDPTIRRVFAIITNLGEGGIYLVPLGLAIIASILMKRSSLAWRLAYVFTAVALPGLLADIAKPVFGRARPALLFRDQMFGFTWQGPRADLWSFPSGHAVTITALATALCALYPRFWPAYVVLALLVASSRVIIDAHYLSDVIAGVYVGFVFAWALAAVWKSNGLLPAPQPGKVSDSP